MSHSVQQNRLKIYTIHPSQSSVEILEI